MKKTLIALLALGSVAFGEAITLSTNFGKGSTNAGDGYSGISFQLTPETDRYTNSGFLSADAAYELTGITIQWRNEKGATKIGDGVHLVVTNASDLKVLGISDSITKLVSAKIPGHPDAATKDQTNLATNTFETPITLALATPYYAFYVADANVQDLKAGDTLTAAKVGSVNLMAWGRNPAIYEGDNADFSFTKGTASDSPNFAPVGYLSITKKGNVPEPTTGTLSLLALAGLCIRRRK